MDVTLSRRDLHDALARARVKGDAGANSEFPAIVRLTAQAGRTTMSLSVSASDIRTDVAIPAVISDGGDVFVPVRPIVRLTDLGPGPTIRLSVHEERSSQLVATCGSVVAHLALVMFAPVQPPPDQEGHVELSAENMADIGRVIFAADSGAAQGAFRGVFIGDGYVATCDGYRVAIVNGLPESPGITVPLDLVKQVLRGTNSGCAVKWGKSWVTFVSGNTSWSSFLLNAVFPNVLALVPTSCSDSIRFDKASLVEALRRVEIIEGVHHVFIQRGGDGHGRIWASSHDDYIVETIELGGTFGKPVCLGLSYLSDAVRAVRGDSVELGINDALSPILIRDSTLTTVVMPISTPETRGEDS